MTWRTPERHESARTQSPADVSRRGSRGDPPIVVSEESRSVSPAPGPAGRRMPACTRRQLECLSWVQEGKSATDIGAILGLSPRTVEGHLAKACEEFGVRTRIQAVLRAKDLGLLPNPTA